MATVPVTVHAAGYPNVWIVDIGTRTYRAAFIGNGYVFHSRDRWLVRNAHRRQYLPGNSPTAARVVAAVRAHEAAKGAK